MIFRKLFKNKIGSSIDAIIITPVWLLIIVYIGARVSVVNTKQDATSAMSVVSRYVALSSSADEAILNVQGYLASRSDGDSFKLEADTFDQSSYFSIGNFLLEEETDEGTISTPAYLSDGSETTITTQDDLITYWQTGLVVRLVLYMKTSFYGGAAEFNVKTPNGTISLSVVDTYVKVYSTIIVIGEW